MKLVVREELCSGCRACETVCAMTLYRENNPKMGAIVIRGLFPAPGRYEIKYCDQCGECAKACPVEAIVIQGGAYVVKEEECTQCMACVDACPNGVMRVPPGREYPAKCNLCGACVAICPMKAVYDEEPGLKAAAEGGVGR